VRSACGHAFHNRLNRRCRIHVHHRPGSSHRRSHRRFIRQYGGIGAGAAAAPVVAAWGIQRSGGTGGGVGGDD